MTFPAAAVLPLLLLTAAAAPLFPELRRPPEVPAEPPARLTPLLPRPESATPEDWKPVRERLQREWTERLGPFPRRGPLKVETVSREEQPDHVRLHLRYGTGEDANEAYLLLPRGLRGPRPGMVVLHQTTEEHMRQPVGISGREAMYLALHLVRRGYVCIAPRNFLWSGPGRAYQQRTEDVLTRARWRTGMAKMTWDAIRATDVLLARPEVDRKRIGSIGHSLGAKEVLYHAAFDSRVRAAVSCEGGIGLSFSNWEADWYLGKQIRAPGFTADHHEVLALVAPRPFLLIGGESADGAQSWPYIEAALPVWRLWDAEERLGLLRHRFGHDFPPPGPERELVYRWLDHWLENRKQDE